MYGQNTRSCQSIITRRVSQISRYHAASSKKRLSPRPNASLGEVENLLDKAANPPRGWKATPSLRGEAKRLSASIKTKKNTAKPYSLEQMAFTSGESTFQREDEENSELALEPGCFVELRKATVSSNGILIGHEYIDRTLTYYSIVVTGEVWHHSKDDVVFDVPNLIPGDLAARCGMSDVATNKHELNARVEVLKRLREIQKSVETAGLIIASRNLDIYSMVKSPDPTKWGSTTVAEVARLLVDKPMLSHIFAAHKYLITNPAKFVATHDYVLSRTFRVRPQAALDRIETIGKWIRTKDPRLQEFAAKGKAILDSNKGSLMYSQGPPQRAKASHHWSESDKVILQFLLDSLRPARNNQADPFVLGISYILRPFTPEDQDVFDHNVHQALVDFGVLAPWQDLSELREELNNDADGSRMASANELASRAYSKRAAVSEPLGPEDLYPTDPLESVRHDFGDLPVYVIDEHTAEELDDGLSIESVPSEPSSFWVHVHIADPTSVLPPTHVIAQRACEIVDTAYFYQTTFPMLPTALTHHPMHGMSLGSASSNGGQPVMTFSAKVNASGDITDYKVRSGFVRNIIVTSYNSVDAALSQASPTYSYPFGHSPEVTPIRSHTESHINDFRLLNEVRQNLANRRLRDGSFTHAHTKAQLYEIQWPSNRAHPTIEPTRFSGFPDMKYRVTSSIHEDVGARNMVAETMKLACRVSSMFCRDHGIPMLRRYATRPTLVSESALQDLLAARSPNGYLSPSQTYPLMISDSVAGYSTDIREHFGLGIPASDGYARVTSPLRRYGDLVTHWQINSVLQGKKPMFSEEWLKDFGIRFLARERLRRRAQGLHEAFWHVYFISRWREAVKSGLHTDCPDPLSGLVGQTDSMPTQNRDSKKWQAEIGLDRIGLKGIIAGLENGEVQPGTSVPVEISAIRLGVRPQIQVAPRV